MRQVARCGKAPQIGEAGVLDILDVCTGMANRMYVLDIDGLERDVEVLGVSPGLSFYDSSCVVVAGRYELDLVTDDKKMLEVARHNGIAAITSYQVAFDNP